MRIRELISKIAQNEIKHTQMNVALLDVAEILSKYNIGALPVADKEMQIVGIISERDIIKFIAKNKTELFSKHVKDAMTKNVITCSPDDMTDEIYGILNTNKIRHIPVVENGKLIAVLSIRDFEKAHEVLRLQSQTDELTGLYNLSHYSVVLNSEFNQFRRFHTKFSLCTIIVDDFNNLNEAKDFAESDALLRQVTGVLDVETRAYDRIGRIADNQFSVLFPNTEYKNAIRACERIIKAVRSINSDVDKASSEYSVSIGVAFANYHDRECNDILERSICLAKTASSLGRYNIEEDTIIDPIGTFLNDKILVEVA